jgi:hypothetical protein
MKNVNPYTADAFTFHKQVCEIKRTLANDLTYKARLASLDANIQLLYNAYDGTFAANVLQTMNPHGYIDPQKADLHRLYKYNSAMLQKLKNEITTTTSGRKVQCQNCTMNEANSLDHLVPKEEFPEFSVNPKNLFPCCSKCNSYKGKNWRSEGVRTSLNLYIDQLPVEQYLFVNTKIGNNVIETEFYLNNPNGVNADLFALITSHYKELYLLKRFSESADDVITSFRAVLESARDKLSLANTRELARNFIAKERIAFGYNYWQSILKSSLIEDNDFLVNFE